jgi:DNA-binding NtrC family response regulator
MFPSISEEWEPEMVIVASSAPGPHGTVSSASDESLADVLRLGANDSLTKPREFVPVRVVPGKAPRVLDTRSRAGAPGCDPCHVGRFGALIGASQPMLRVYDLIGRVARTSASVLISGETGTGKEVVAQTIHSLSHRRNQPFLALNCGAVSAALIESEVFGHERGSFTGADRLHKGYFERADRGTLFLDEISEMPGELQVRLLRVLETSAVSRVGGTETLKLDVRIIAATNQRPDQAVAAGRLRQDLLYRLNVFPMALPPLRERGSDVLLLAEEFLSDLNLAEGTAKKFTAATLERLLLHTWPGNVRELRNVVHRAFILAEEEVGVDCVGPGVLGSIGGEGSLTVARCASSLVIQLGTSLAEAERRLILGALDHFGCDKEKASKTLGISVKTIYNRLREYRAGGGSEGTVGIHEKVVSIGRARLDGARSRARPPGP